MISEFQFKRNLYKNVSENLSEMDIWHIQLWILLGNEEVRERADGEGNSCGGATKKREISRTSLTINIHFSSHNTKYFPK